jgi:hypothetical protein
VNLVQAAPVAAAGRWVAYCRTSPAAPRALLKLPGPLGLPPTNNSITSGLSLASQVATNFAQDTVSPSGPRAPRAVDVHRAVAWTLRTPTPVDLGPCDKIGQTAQQSGAGVAAVADLRSAGNPNAGPFAAAVAAVKGIGPSGGQTLALAPLPQPEIPPTPEPAPENPPEPIVIAASVELGFSLAQGIENHESCPGHYIIGAVVNRNGAPMPGVRISLVDEWGNRADAVSKGGATDGGQYDFPINNFPNRYTLTVVDADGSPVSAPVTVEHLQGYGGSSPCHTVVWQAY